MPIDNSTFVVGLALWYAWAIDSAISLFLAFYLGRLLLQAQSGHVDAAAATMPIWLNLINPVWLDYVSIPGIVKAFAWALAAAAITWTAGAMLVLIVMIKVHGP